MTNIKTTLRASKTGALHTKIAASIGTRICAGEFPPGATLPNEAEWGRSFRASRTAVREAMKALQAKGLVVTRPKVGAKVAPREAWNVLDRDVFAWHSAAVGRKALITTSQEFRRHIEPGIAELAALKRTPRQLTALGDALTWMRDAKDDTETVAADVAFHTGLLACANNELLNPFVVLIEATLSSLFSFTTTANRRRERQAWELHERIWKAVRDQNPEAARRSMQALIADTDRVVSGTT